VYNVGLKREGKTHTAKTFDRFRSWYVLDWRFFLLFHYGRKDPSASEAKHWLRPRDRALRLEVEAPRLLGPSAPVLSEMFPESLFNYIIREPRSWLHSVLDLSYPDGAGVRHNTHQVWVTIPTRYGMRGSVITSLRPPIAQTKTVQF
jgi:hypothetical protein